MVDVKVVNKILVFSLILALFVAGFFILKSILISIFIGILLAYILHPLYVPLKKRIKNPNLSTTLFLILLVFILAIPLWFILPAFAREIFDAYIYLQRIDLSSAVLKVANFFFSEETARAFAVQLNVGVAKFFSYSMNSLTSMFSNIGNIVIQFSIVLFTIFFMIRDSDKLKLYLSELSPLPKKTQEKFGMEFRNITNSIVFGQLATGLVQGLALGAALWILGVPKVLFLTTIAIVTSIIPLIGAWLVWAPVSLILIVSGQVTEGVILFLYGLLFVSTIDNVLRPLFIARQSNINIFIAILGTIGGLYAFGFIGIILGPLILSYLLIIIEFYREGKLNELFRE